VLGLVLGLVAQSASTAISGSNTLQKAIARLGGHRTGAATYLGVAFLTAAVLVAFAAAGQIASIRNEESSGYLDNLLVRPVARWRWLLGRLGIAAAIIAVGSAISGLAGWLGAASQHSGLTLSELVKAGINLAPPALFVLGIGALVYGLLPRLAPAFVYAFVTWSFLVEFVASVVKSNHYLLDTSVISHIRPVPAADMDWASASWLLALGALAAVAGTIIFSRRDVVNA
jgi:ABC-2 type transport system permease protein